VYSSTSNKVNSPLTVPCSAYRVTLEEGADNRAFLLKKNLLTLVLRAGLLRRSNWLLFRDVLPVLKTFLTIPFKTSLKVLIQAQTYIQFQHDTDCISR
jgi:hypothetical protein